jgi:SH3-like domain-containing protein
MLVLSRFTWCLAAVLVVVVTLAATGAGLAEPRNQARDEAKPAEARPSPGKVAPGTGGEAGTGMPVPRFAALGSDKINARAGPASRYPVEWVFVRRGLPVEITQEFEFWRKVRDLDGAEGWVHKSLLSGRRTVLIRGPQTRELKREPDERTAAVARVEPGVIGRLLKCRGAWCQVSIADRRGWLPKPVLWGVYADEQIE